MKEFQNSYFFNIKPSIALYGLLYWLCFIQKYLIEIHYDFLTWKFQASRNTDQLPAFFAVYNMETTEIVAFYQVLFHYCFVCFVFFVEFSNIDMIYYFIQNAADELYLLFERFCDHFHATSINSMYMNFISSHSNNIHALEQLKSMKNKATSISQVLISLSEFVTSLPFYSFLVYFMEFPLDIFPCQDSARHDNALLDTISSIVF